jgi:hypothetical protein
MQIEPWSAVDPRTRHGGGVLPADFGAAAPHSSLAFMFWGDGSSSSRWVHTAISWRVFRAKFDNTAQHY